MPMRYPSFRCPIPFFTVLAILTSARLFAQPGSLLVRESSLRSSALQALNDEIELRWDFNEPIGYMALSDGDSACVTFPSIPGGRLDSLRIALRRAGMMFGTVWRHGSSGSPLGSPRLADFIVYSNTTPSSPYPVPWTNWAAVDLRMSGIPTDSPFSVSLINRGNPQIAQRLMVTEFVGSTVHSYTYLQRSDSVNASGWYILPVGLSPDTSYAYLVRAYIATPTAVSRSSGNPAAFSLGQNFPNPFNPTTVISGQWAATSVVRLSVYDILGREVAILADGQYPAGTYRFTFDGSNLASGVYFCRLTAGRNTAVRTIVLTK